MSNVAFASAWARRDEFATMFQAMTMLTLADEAGRDGVCELTVTQIADMSLMSVRKAYDVLDELQAAGEIAIEKAPGPGPRRRYRLLRASAVGVSP